ncbi:MAG: response regulator transcription factor [Steroidobacteraceae bacterium]|nr:response regulator transcription factor [Steroidobacteraceae bacterium]
MRILITDDEAPARERLRRLLADVAWVEVVGEAASGEEALARTRDLEPDIVLMDVRMPGMDGLEAAQRIASLPEPPAVIFVTAHEEHALAAFDSNAAGYLLKPVRADKLVAAIERAQRLTRAQAAGAAAAVAVARRQITVRLRDQLRLIPVEDVLSFVADQKYVTVRHLQGEDLLDESLKALEDEFAAEFVRIHRNALVAIRHLEALERGQDGQYTAVLRHGGGRLPVSRRLAGEVLRRLRTAA